MNLIRRALLVASSLLASTVTQAATADDLAAFYRSRNIDFLIGAAAGGAYDLPGRVLAHHLGGHLPGNPTVTVKNMPGGNGLLMTNHLYNVAPQDGTVIGMPNNAIPLEPLLKVLSPNGDNVRFDVTRLQWIGSPAQETYATIVWHTAPVRTVDDLRNVEILTAGTQSLGEAVALPTLMNALAGTRMNVVKGYPGQNEIFLAMERGEIEANTTGVMNLTSSRAEWVRDGKIRIMIQYTANRDSPLKDVPFALDLVKTDEDRAVLTFLFSKYQMARGIFAGPKVRGDRVAALRSAFDATMDDPAFRDEATKVGIEISPMSGKDIANLVASLYRTPPAIVERARATLLLAQR
jgi:tripartite-type tricarboxylate transporter receptor subunit TctC